MNNKVKAGINTSRQQFDYVFNRAAQKKLSEYLLIDFDLVPEAPNRDNIRAGIEDAEVIISTWGALPYTKDILDACPNLRLILYGAGSFKACATPELSARDVTVCTAVHMNAQPVAEFTLGLILTSMKNVTRHNAALHQKGKSAWAGQRLNYNGGYYHTKIGLLGYGVIVRNLLRLLKNFEFDVIIADENISFEKAEELGVKKADVDHIMKTCDVISIHHADVPRNWNMVNRDNLALMKPGSRLINTSRGRMVNEQDLVEKLKDGEITAYLDVTHPEPPVEDHPFYALPNCIMTPHVAGSIGTEVERLGDYCVRELENWLSGVPLENRIDIEALGNRA